MHTTNYTNAFITVSADTRATEGTTPPERANPSVAALCFEMLVDAPYQHTSDDVLFTVWADRKGIPEGERAAAREQFFSEGQACFRASPLPKTYGWGVHHDAEGRVALVPMESPDYAHLAAGRGPDGEELTVVAAMKSRR